MKVIIRAHCGNPEGLQVTTLERPVPRKSKVPVRVKAAGCDHGKWHLMSGKPHAMGLAMGLTKPQQRVLGMDMSSVVVAVGEAAIVRRRGAFIWCLCSGTAGRFGVRRAIAA
jgi:NADPH:quinone reductase-like Zn-dependent oxidoreductase